MKMPCLLAQCLLVLVAVVSGHVADKRERSLLQTYGEALDGTDSRAGARATPVKRVVNLLKEMQATLKKEMDDDEGLYDKLKCWCNGNNYEKGNSMSDAEAKIAGLEATIEGLTAKSTELNTKIKVTAAEVAADKASLAEATAQREKEVKAFHGSEMDSITAVENLKAALVVLSKHHGAALPQLSLSLLQAVGGKDGPWATGHESHMDHSLDEFMRTNGFATSASGDVEKAQGFLQDHSPLSVAPSWSADELAAVRLALKSGRSFMQAHHEQTPGDYTSRSGEIVGVLKQLKEEMEADLSEAQKEESARAAAFAELRNAKTEEITSGEQMEETKEDELANTDNALAEAKEDLGQTQATLSEDQKFSMNLKKTCAEAEVNFDARKKVRMEEITAVSETIGILTSDDARDAMTATYSLVQVSSRTGRKDQRRRAVAVTLRLAAAKLHSPQLSALATSVELDAFTKVKKAIDGMVATLKNQQADEVAKNGWCKSQLNENEKTTMETDDLKLDLEAKVGDLGSAIERFTEELATAKAEVASLELSLQRASENRKADNLEFQTTIADQTATKDALKMALDRMAKFYDKEFLLQTRKGHQTPPVPQAEYTPNSGSTGVMGMIEKLIHEADEMKADARKGEMEATAAYEALVEDTNASILALQREITSKSAANAKAGKDKLMTEGDLVDTVKELEELAAYSGDVHGECDYVLKNFMARQEARAQEMEALQQAKQILSGADLS